LLYNPPCLLYNPQFLWYNLGVDESYTE